MKTGGKLGCSMMGLCAFGIILTAKINYHELR